MTRARVNSGKAAKRPVAATPDASLPLDASVLSIVANLEGLDLSGLRRQWRAHVGGEHPAHLPCWLLMRVLAYRLQADAFGDLEKPIRRILRSGKEDGVGAPFDRREPQTREGLSLRIGALLVREWKGQLERVIILEEGFAWNGQTFGSLSQIAKAMTGTNWNGHRFFGLREGMCTDPLKMMLPLSFMRGAAELTVKKATVEVGVDYLLEDGFVGRASRRPARNACVSEDDVKFAKVLGEFSEELLGVLRNRNVSAVAMRFRSQLGDRVIQCLLITTRNCDFRPSEMKRRAGWIPTRSATPSTALVPQRKVGFPIPNALLLLGFQGTKTARREGISNPFSDAGGCTSPQNSGPCPGRCRCCLR